jgi:DNA-binding response OmpR family regulator
MAKSILLFDDEIDFSELLQFRLRDCGYQISSATNGAEALNQARLYLPDAILLDLLLPDWDWLTLCELLRRQPSTSATPVIMISGIATDVTRHSATLTGACAYFTKPLDFRGLQAKLHSFFTAPAPHFRIDPPCVWGQPTAIETTAPDNPGRRSREKDPYFYGGIRWRVQRRRSQHAQNAGVKAFPPLTRQAEVG